MINLKRPELAVNGGVPVRDRAWLANITTGAEELNAVMRVVRSGSLSAFEGAHEADDGFSFFGGPEVIAFENEWKLHYGIPHAVSMNSATSGLFAAVGALGLGYGDEVIVSPYTMTACALAPLIYGAIPVFADVSEQTGCLRAESVAEKISERTTAIIVVHQFGFPAEMSEIMRLAELHDLRVIEDCAQAHGAKYQGQFVGTFGDIGVFSLNVNKTIQSGEGGMCITRDADLAYRLQLIRNHGEAVVERADYSDILNIAGWNYRMGEMSAAVAREQLAKLDSLTAWRLNLVSRLLEGIKSIDFLTPLSSEALCRDCECEKSLRCFSTYYVFPLRFSADLAGISRSQFVRAMTAEGIKIYEGYSKPLYLQPLYQRKLLFRHGYPFSAKENLSTRQEYDLGVCPTAERLYFEEVIIFEHVRYPMEESDIDDIIGAVRKITG